MAEDDALVDFFRECATALTAAADGTPAAVGARRFADALVQSSPVPFEPGRCAALETVELARGASSLADRFVDVAALLPWQPTHRADDGGRDLALAPVSSVRDIAPIDAGVMYVRPGAQYPLHSHPPQEVYLVIAGSAEWRYGGHEQLRPVAPGSTVYNHPRDLHTVIAGEVPLVAFYVLWE